MTFLLFTLVFLFCFGRLAMFVAPYEFRALRDTLQAKLREGLRDRMSRAFRRFIFSGAKGKARREIILQLEHRR